MAEILGLGMTHYPPLTGLDQNMAGILRRVLQDPGLPEQYRAPSSWPDAMRAEYADDGGTASAAGHRDAAGSPDAARTGCLPRRVKTGLHLLSTGSSSTAIMSDQTM